MSKNLTMKRSLLLFVVALLSLSSGCLLFDGGGKKLVSEEDAAEGDERAEDPYVLTPDQDTIEGLNSYRSTLTIRTEFENGMITGSVFGREATRHPAATSRWSKDISDGAYVTNNLGW